METRKLGDVVPYDKNPRKNEKAVEHVLESLRIHGQVKPLVVSAKGHPFEGEVLCAGHTTLQALEEFGAQEARVIVKEFADESEFVDYNIRDNKTSEFAIWDDTILAELGGKFDIDLDGMGFVDFDDVDYSVLDEEDDGEADGMADDVKKSIQIEFNIEDYEEAKKLVDQARKDEVYIGGKLIQALS